MSPKRALPVGAADSYYTNGASIKASATELERLIARLPAHDTPVARPARTPATRSIRDLRADELAAMIADYQSGATLIELASKHGYNRVGISCALKHASVRLRNQGLNTEQIDQAVRLYQSGMSLARIGDRFDVNATTVRTRLIQRGVTMRPASERA